jgi:hypothetical protein
MNASSSGSTSAILTHGFGIDVDHPAGLRPGGHPPPVGHPTWITHRSSVQASTDAQRQLHALVTAAPETLRGRVRDLATRDLVTACARLRQRTDWDAEATATAASLRALARRIRELDRETAEHSRAIAKLQDPADRGGDGRGSLEVQRHDQGLAAGGLDPFGGRLGAAEVAAVGVQDRICAGHFHGAARSSRPQCPR